MGNPVGHSLSPVLHNTAFRSLGIEAVYLAFCVTDAKSAMDAMRTLGILGMSVTVPHKISVMENLDEIDPVAERIGAVNTVVNRDGILFGTNTDCSGVVRAVSGHVELPGKAALVIGAGGAARAAAFGMADSGCSVTITNRSIDKGESLAKAVSGHFIPFSDIFPVYDIIINTTSLGMTPLVDEMPPVANAMSPGAVVMDAVYAPLKTLLLKTAEGKGLITINGLSMFVHQAAAQFELWTGVKAPVDVMEKSVLEVLQTNNE